MVRNRGWRRAQTERHIKKQVEQRVLYSFNNDNIQGHRYHKQHSLNCGQPNCVICGNPRRIFGEKTMQERRFECLPEAKADGDWVDMVVVDNWNEWKDWELAHEQ